MFMIKFENEKGVAAILNENQICDIVISKEDSRYINISMTNGNIHRFICDDFDFNSDTIEVRVYNFISNKK